MIAVLNNTILTISIDIEDKIYIIRSNSLALFKNIDIPIMFEILNKSVKKLYENIKNERIEYLLNAFNTISLDNIDNLKNKIIITKNIESNNINLFYKNFAPDICNNVYIKTVPDSIYYDTDGNFMEFDKEYYININEINNIKASKRNFIVRVFEISYLKCNIEPSLEQIKERISTLDFVKIDLEE